MYYLLLFLVITYYSLISISFYYLLHSLGIRPYQTLRAILVFLLIDTSFVPHSLSIVVYVEDLSILYLLVLILSNPSLTVRIVPFPYMPFSNLFLSYLLSAWQYSRPRAVSSNLRLDFSWSLTGEYSLTFNSLIV